MHSHPRPIAPALAFAQSLAILILLAQPKIASACLWDRDTLWQEASGQLEVVDAILGRYDVFPPRYYELRLERVEKELAEAPTRLDLYDDAAVACDRLGRADEAIAWMARKETTLASGNYNEQERFDHHYRYLANLGTFHAHRWVKNGMDRQDMSDLVRGHDLIAEAIAHNPDAHFGRERYQLMFLKALASGQADSASGLISSEAFSRETLKRHDAPEGLAGLVVLGAAQRSPDVMHLLAWALEAKRDAHLAELAKIRTEELIAGGIRSVFEALPLEEARRGAGLYESDRNTVREYWLHASKSTSHWRAQRAEYLEAMFAKGQHPDTHPEVWARAPNPPLPPMPGSGYWAQANKPLMIGIGALALAIALAGLQAIKSGKRRGVAR